MSSPDHKSTDPHGSRRPNESDALGQSEVAGAGGSKAWSLKAAGGDYPLDASAAKVAHELSSLLDGSLRNVGLVIAALRKAAEVAGDDAAAGGTPGADGIPGAGGGDPGAATAGAGAGGTVGAEAAGIPGAGVDEQLLKKLTTVNQAMKQMAELIHRWKSGSPAPAGAATQGTLGEAVEQATRLLEPVAREAGIELTCEVDRRAAGLPYGAVFAVVVNAIRNAIEATQAAEVGDGGRRGVQVAAKVDGAWAQVTVTDWGAGIDGRLLDERGCFRFGATTKGPGRGLGLLLSRDIVQGLGGTLELSNGLSGGAVLTLRLAVKE